MKQDFKNIDWASVLIVTIWLGMVCATLITCAYFLVY